jgi:hypothetical protein
MRSASTLATLFSVLAAAGPLSAQELSGQARVEAAETAYDEGVSRFEAGDFAAAGAAFERADALLPARVAMENAIRAYREAGDDRRAATVATALIGRDISARRQARFVPDVARESFEVTVSCDAPCTMTVDGEETRYRTFFFAPNEPHVFRATFETGVRETASTGGAGEERSLFFEAPAPEEQDGDRETDERTDETGGRDSEDRRGEGFGFVPLWATLTAGAITLGLVGVTVWSGIDTSNARSAHDLSPSLEGFNAGQSKELRTNILLGVTIGVGLTTAVLAVLTDWSLGGQEEQEQQERQDAAIRFGFGPMEGGGYASLSGRLR